MIDTDELAKDAYWCAVEDCLVAFHGWDRHDARARLEWLRRETESEPDEMAREIVYHAEPFDVACDIAGRRLDLDKVEQDYDAILARHARWSL